MIMVGETVQIRSGGPKMTVKAINASTATVQWFDNGLLQESEVSLNVLKPAYEKQEKDILFG